MMIEYYSHIPNVSLYNHNGFDIGVGSLLELPFEKWCQLDPTFSDNESKYKKSKPVFVKGQIEISDDHILSIQQLENVVSQKLDNTLRLIQLAFLLHPHCPIVPPLKMSVTYCIINEKGIIRFIGALEREWIIFGNVIDYKFDDSQLVIVKNNYEFLTKFDESKAYDGISAGINTLYLTTIPEVWWGQSGINKINDFIHCITALEYILLPSREESRGIKLTSTFGQNCAVLLSSNREELVEMTEIYSNVYRLRSRLIHGETGISKITDEEWNLLLSGRTLLRNVILFAITLKHKIKEDTPLPELLSKAYSNIEFHQSLLKVLGEII
jgi:hypothetical protein